MELKVNPNDLEKRYLLLYSVHSKNLISISALDDTLFYTSSEDNTIRLWDLRV
jgi:WD40 repeat protein